MNTGIISGRGFFNAVPFQNPSQVLDTQPPEPGDPSPNFAYSGPLANTTFAGQPFAWFLGIALSLLLIKWLGESPNIPGVPSNIRVNVINILTITLTAIIGLAGLKALMHKFPVPGLAGLVQLA